MKTDPMIEAGVFADPNSCARLFLISYADYHEAQLNEEYSPTEYAEYLRKGYPTRGESGRMRLRARSMYVLYLMKRHDDIFHEYLGTLPQREQELMLRWRRGVVKQTAKVHFPEVPDTPWCWSPPEEEVNMLLEEERRSGRGTELLDRLHYLAISLPGYEPVANAEEVVGLEREVDW